MPLASSFLRQRSHSGHRIRLSSSHHPVTAGLLPLHLSSSSTPTLPHASTTAQPATPAALRRQPPEPSNAAALRRQPPEPSNAADLRRAQPLLTPLTTTPRPQPPSPRCCHPLFAAPPEHRPPVNLQPRIALSDRRSPQPPAKLTSSPPPPLLFAGSLRPTLSSSSPSPLPSAPSSPTSVTKIL